MLFTTKWLTTFLTDYQGAAQDAIAVDAVTTDSRQEVKKALFIPLEGEKFDGHDYVKQAFDNGAVAVIWNKQRPLPRFLPTDFPVFFVEDTLTALQTLAENYRDKIDPTVIAITGSNGKTTTKDIVAAVMKSSYRTHYTNGNFNNHIGVPLTILSMPIETEVLVLEMGMNHFGEIEQLSILSKPDFAIITNIGESHIEYLGSREGIAKAKLEITQGLKQNGLLLIDGDEPLIESMHKRDNVITCGFENSNDVIIESVRTNHNETVFNLSDGHVYHIPLLGKHHAKNAAYAVALGSRLGIDKDVIKQALQTLTLTSMRFEIMTGTNDVSVINDAYNASPTSMKAAIEVVKQMTGFTDKVLVLGDMFELGDYANELHRSVAAVIDDSITVLFTLGEHAEEITKAVEQHHPNITCNHFTSQEALTDALGPYLKKDALLLFKASRGMQFESFVNAIIHP
ncbi:UDP-N-acetylmuramoyl-tripeptide--D-alanyl-D-alanine ligase [Virgibacillus dakarensis]|uniref:UDP-N-acetylmuramoyl-tripeptide--D-alanyl-D-alanine ligase n=1 Tax=Lentibacillus populi TaxID=1827502 RepID=A0A9W5TXX4_9BACI|nr:MULTISPECIES: UDP-N-acetylmuramoyl-tripeptide--D-alanyl-D-alanine ligase [Bacillaceae]MTW85344.1 UDP-N-acetylmuramoyl-tripeptide--D-alanyl-D-alanine ligase [Virgibacillus dakarensis]GGB45145.1 UDP-N-acetylmuramoyl-tripeptide--D-alanyl-D-alanine ligase [Lentibacillus populi]